MYVTICNRIYVSFLAQRYGMAFLLQIIAWSTLIIFLHDLQATWALPGGRHELIHGKSCTFSLSYFKGLDKTVPSVGVMPFRARSQCNLLDEQVTPGILHHLCLRVLPSMDFDRSLAWSANLIVFPWHKSGLGRAPYQSLLVSPGAFKAFPNLQSDSARDACRFCTK